MDKRKGWNICYVQNCLFPFSCFGSCQEMQPICWRLLDSDDDFDDNDDDVDGDYHNNDDNDDER